MVCSKILSFSYFFLKSYPKNLTVQSRATWCIFRSSPQSFLAFTVGLHHLYIPACAYNSITTTNNEDDCLQSTGSSLSDYKNIRLYLQCGFVFGYEMSFWIISYRLYSSLTITESFVCYSYYSRTTSLKLPQLCLKIFPSLQEWVENGY